ncbi:MAG: EF2563 family selenium-dependent molybdenum hydroxylase system protein [Fusobacteriaceae bacterium]|nr:EF2563 family selenium-dependent molybdenum hydroxylase system protein [Fusobacteriaceae bacterium]
MRELIIIRGGGDLASGVIQKFNRAGFDILVLEIEKPNFIRRKVCYGAAIYEGEVMLEGSISKYAGNILENDLFSNIESMLNDKIIPVIVDSQLEILDIIKNQYSSEYKVIAVIDSIIAKKNLGMKQNLAPITVALGPGFFAGKDVDIVIETMRGHDLGRLIFQGEALPNTGVPGLVGGEAELRVVHSPREGILTIVKDIGDLVNQGDVIAKIGTEEVKATITGLIRGMITNRLYIKKGLKIADIDPRKAEYKNCFTISDKARTLGGSALEAVLYMRNIKNV